MNQSGESGGSPAGSGPPSEAVHTYRCPVCGHTDGVSFMGSESVKIECSHCSASLELTLRSEEKERVSAQVDTGE